MISIYITVKSLNKTLGKYVEMSDLYLGIPILFLFLIMFSFTSLKLESLIILTIGLFLLIPIQMSKKNRMYKIMIMFFKYLFKNKEYIYMRNNANFK